MKYLLTTLLSIFSLVVTAQSLPIGFHLQTELLSSLPEHYTLNMKGGEQVASGDIKDNLRARINAGYTQPLSRKLMVGLAGRYEYNNEELTGLANEHVERSDNHHRMKASMNVMYNTRLWNKPLIAFVNGGIDFSQWGAERFSVFGAAVLMLKATRETQFGVGALVMLNTTSRLPFIPIATYRHTFSPKWTLNLNYPFLGMQYTPSQKHTLAMGFTVDTDYYWVHPDNENLPETAFFRRSLLKTGFNYNCKLSPTLTFTAQTGWEYTMVGGLYTANGRHQLMEMNHPNGMYAHIGISFRPKNKYSRMMEARKL